MTVREKCEKVKTHVRENKVTYLVGGGCLMTGYFLRPQIINIVDVCNLKYKSPTETTIINILERRACPDPIPVRDKLTGEIYASLNRAVKVTGETMKSISKDVHGPQERFESLSNSVFA